MAKKDTKAIIETVIVIVVGLAMFPVVQQFIQNINFSLSLGANSYDLSFVGFLLQLVYLLGVAFAGYKMWDVAK